jgi:hypothetical protein
MTLRPTVILNAVKDLLPKNGNCRVDRSAQAENPPQITAESQCSKLRGITPAEIKNKEGCHENRAII